MRSLLAGVFMLLAVVLPAAALGSSWAWSVGTDTDRFMAGTRSLATDRVVQDAVARRLADAVAERLPAGVDPGDRLLVAAQRLTRSPAYRRAWRQSQRRVHADLVDRLEGRSSAPLELDLDPLAAVLRDRVAAAGIPASLVQLDLAPVQVATAAEVADARRAAEAVEVGRLVAAGAALLALLGVLLTAPGLGSGLRRAGVCLGLSLALLAGLWWLGDQALTGTAAAVYAVVTASLWTWGAVAAAVAVVLVLAGLVLRRPAED